MPLILLLVALVGLGAWVALRPANGQVLPEALRARLVRPFPHDREAFTQGLLWHDGHLYESTGLYGHSTVRRVELDTGRVAQTVALDRGLFGEGLALVGERLIQLTWQGGKALVWDRRTLEPRGELEYRGEGWGLCWDEQRQRLVKSSGSDRLSFHDPDTFEEVGHVRVTRAGRRQPRLNELECVGGLVYANIWTDDHIARIDPESGHVTGWIDASGLLRAAERDGTEDVLNGIAWVPQSGHFLLTGKKWPRVFEVEFVPAR